MWKWICCGRTAVYSFTGTATAPNSMTPFQSARAMGNALSGVNSCLH
jgi:hypothetical protein